MNVSPIHVCFSPIYLLFLWGLIYFISYQIRWFQFIFVYNKLIPLPHAERKFYPMELSRTKSHIIGSIRIITCLSLFSLFIIWNGSFTAVFIWLIWGAVLEVISMMIIGDKKWRLKKKKRSI